MNKRTIYAITNCTLDDQVGVRNYNCDDHKVLIEIQHENLSRGPRQYAQVTPREARILAKALILAADEIDAG